MVNKEIAIRVLYALSILPFVTPLETQAQPTDKDTFQISFFADDPCTPLFDNILMSGALSLREVTPGNRIQTIASFRVSGTHPQGVPVSYQGELMAQFDPVTGRSTVAAPSLFNVRGRFDNWLGNFVFTETNGEVRVLLINNRCVG